jgi:hypothetical protein
MQATNSGEEKEVRVFSLVLIYIFMGSSIAHAGLMGADVNLSAYYPDSSSLYENGGDAIVSGGVEYPGVTIYQFWETDINDSQLIFNWTVNDTATFLGGTFNGFILTILSDKTFSSASIDAVSGFDPISLSIAGNGTQLLINYSGVNIPALASSVINFEVADSSSVPLPATLTLFGLGFAGIGWSRRRKA